MAKSVKDRPWKARFACLSGDRELRNELKALEAEGGWEGRLTRGGHMQLRHISGALVCTSMTSSDWRSTRNLRSEIRREVDRKTQEKQEQESSSTALPPGKTNRK